MHQQDWIVGRSWMKLQETDSTIQMPIYDLSIVSGGKRINLFSQITVYQNKYIPVRIVTSL